MTVLPYIALSYRQTLQWSTDVLSTHDGHESRAAILHAPRERYELTLALTEEEARALRFELHARPIDTHEIPLPNETTTAEAAITGTSIVVDTTYADWVAVGQRVLVSNAAGDWYATHVTAIGAHPSASTTLTVNDAPSGGSYPAGSEVTPLASILLDDPQATALHQVNEGVWTLHARRSTIHSTWGTGATVDTFDGRPVVDEDLVMEGELVQEQALGGSELIDAGGAIDRERGWLTSSIQRSHTFETEDRARVAWIKKFLQTVRGRWKAFLLPTGRADLTLDSQPGAAAVQLDVNGGDDLVDSYPDDAAHLWLKLVYADGTSSLHTIDAVTPGTPATLDITPATGAAAVDHVELLEQCRLDSDEVTISWDRAWRARVSWGAVLVQDPAASAPATFDEAETSVAASEPIELYVFTVGATVYRYTSYGKDVVYAAQTYTALAGLARDSFTGKPSAPGEISISLPASSAFAQAQLAGIPPKSITVTITRYQSSPALASVFWVGTISQPVFAGRMVTVKSVSVIAKSLQREVPGRRYLRTCGHVLYDPHCGILAADHDVATTIVSVSGRDIVLAGIDGNPDEWANGGEIVRDSDGERRTILTQEGVNLEVEFRFKTLNNGDAVTVYRGCRHTIEACRDDFDNVVNFGGFPFIPKTNIFRTRSRWWLPGGGL